MLSQDLISVKLFDRIDSFVQTLSFFLKEVCKQFHAYFNLGEKKRRGATMYLVQFHASPSEPTKEAQTKEPKGSTHSLPSQFFFFLSTSQALLSAPSLSEAKVDRGRRGGGGGGGRWAR